ncbi:FAD-dependent oxidoreductase [Streptomyces acidiscabies]|uniref:FAD-dependent oxidoreductase n=1 Tax=Streptomyces acidiscabies TaxID=42234 RepID=UPI00076ED057|nr:FAD-dependent oxidoreductase [Streptomyces acidiscabies]GAQ53059.1 pentachlorophenol 4-monooxygenase [Streptomyces acidiscabies]
MQSSDDAVPMRVPGPDVLVVGAGPVGQTAAHELVRRGVRVRLVDGAAGPAVTSRATANHARTLETYYQMGILDDLLPRGQRAEHFTMHRAGRELIRFDTDYSMLPTRFPFTLQVDQVITEEVLRNRLRGYGVEVEWGVGLTEVTPRADGVDARLVHADGTVEEVTVPWLVGADGGHSVVRKQLGFELLGDSTETWLIADAVLEADLPRDSLHWLHVEGSTILLVPFPEPGKWRLLDTRDVDGADRPDVVSARFARKISRALGQDVVVRTPTWISVFTIQQRMVQQMRSGRCFVAGDAAHVHSPASGQGMNTGIQDACNLGWKLADVIHGHAADELLDTYAAERVPIGETLLNSTRTATGLVALRNAAAPVALPLGLGFLKAVKPLKRKVERTMMGGMSGLLLHYAASPLTMPGAAEGIAPGHRVGCSSETELSSPGWRAMNAELADPRWTLLVFAGDPVDTADLREDLEQLDDNYGTAVSVRTVYGRSAPPPDALHPLADPGNRLATDLGASAGDFVLVRPDGYVCGKGRFGDARQMTRTLRRAHLLPAKDTQ